MQFAFVLVLPVALCLVLFGVHEVNGDNHFVQPQHINQTQNATVLCSKNGTEYCMMVRVTQNGEAVQAVFMRNHTDPTQNSHTFFDSLLTGAIALDIPTSSFSFELCWTYAGPPGPPVLIAPADSALAYIEGTDTVSVDVVSKSVFDLPNGIIDQITWPNDVLYYASCNSTEVVDDILTTGNITVLGSIKEVAEVVKFASRLRVWNVNISAEGGVAALGDPLFLELLIDQTTALVPDGAYLYSLFVCDVSDCSGTHKVPLLDAGGCPIVAGYLDSFLPLDGTIKTNIFPAFALNVGDVMYFQGTAGHCGQPGDPRCTDFCAFNTGKRKKRESGDEDDEEETVLATITITRRRSSDVGGFGDDLDEIFVQPSPAAPVEDTKTVGLIAAVITLAGLLMVGLIVAVAVFFRLSRRDQVKEKSMN